jgi:hypothetical protein
MARMRTIKPGFFKNEDLLECEPLARILFEGLWCWGDREGRLEDRPKRLKMEILPADNCDVEQLLVQLVRADMILRYEVDGQRFIQIPTFKRHNTPHYKETGSVIPPPPGWPGANPGSNQGEPLRDLGSGEWDQGSGEEDPGSCTPAHETSPATSSNSLRLPDQAAPSTGLLEDGGSPSGNEAGAEEVCAAAVSFIEADGWRFGIDELALLDMATADFAIEAHELPAALGRRLYRRSSKAHPDWSAKVPATWSAMDAPTVSAWCLEAIGIAKRKAGPDRERWLDFAAGAIGKALEVGSDLVEVERRRAGISVSTGPAPNRPPDDHLQAIAAAAAVKTQLENPEEGRRGKLAMVAAARARYGPGTPKLAAALQRHGVTERELEAYLAEPSAAGGAL